MIREFLKRILGLIKRTDITFLEVKKNGLSLKLKRGFSLCSKPKTQDLSIEIFTQKSESIGVIKKVLAKKGQKVKKDQVLAQIESLGIINEILCEKDGILEEILIKEGEIVEFGEKLFIIKLQESIF